MGILEKEGGLPVFDTDNLKCFFCQLLKLSPSSRIKSPQIYQPWRVKNVKKLRREILMVEQTREVSPAKEESE